MCNYYPTLSLKVLWCFHPHYAPAWMIRRCMWYIRMLTKHRTRTVLTGSRCGCWRQDVVFFLMEPMCRRSSATSGIVSLCYVIQTQFTLDSENIHNMWFWKIVNSGNCQVETDDHDNPMTAITSDRFLSLRSLSQGIIDVGFSYLLFA